MRIIQWWKTKYIYFIIYFAAVLAIWKFIGPISICDTLVPPNTESIQIKNRIIDASDIEAINNNPKINRLLFYNCDFNSIDLDKPDIAFFGCHFANDAMTNSNLHAESLSFELCTGDMDFSFIEKINSLENLTINNSGLNDSNAPGLLPSGLKNLCIRDNTDLTQLSWINPDIVSVDCSGSGIVSLGYIAKLQNIRTLRCDNCPISSINEPFDATFLHTLSIKGLGLRDCPGLANLTLLSDVNLEGNSFIDFSFLSRSSEALRALNISNNPVTQDGIEILTSFANLEELYMCGFKTSNISFAENMPRLHIICAVNCGLNSIEGLRNLENLSIVRLAFNEISDISPLSRSAQSGNLKVIDIYHNNISDIHSIENMNGERVVLFENPIDIENYNNDFLNTIAQFLYFKRSDGKYLMIDTKRDGGSAYPYSYISDKAVEELQKVETEENGVISNYNSILMKW